MYIGTSILLKNCEIGGVGDHAQEDIVKFGKRLRRVENFGFPCGTHQAKRGGHAMDANAIGFIYLIVHP